MSNQQLYTSMEVYSDMIMLSMIGTKQDKIYPHLMESFIPIVRDEIFAVAKIVCF